MLALLLFHCVFLWTHDWIPYGRLNDVAVVRAQDTTGRLLFITVLQSLPWTILLIACACYYHRAYPMSLQMGLWGVSWFYFVGLFNAWWIPYLWHADAKRVARYQAMFGNTHSFLPVHNGIAPNTFHVAWHLVLAATLVVLYIGLR